MAERTVLGILILLSLHQTYAALDVSAPSTQRALFTRDTILICSFSVDKQTLDLNLLIILWTFQGKVIMRYDNKVFSTQDPRMSLNVESLGDGYTSLYISNVTISDRGTYVCTVIYKAESKEKEISLKVFAKPLLSIKSTKVQRNTKNTLTCKATGFFPPDILITWYKNGEVLRNHFMGKPQMYKDGMYQVDSTLTITPTKDDQNQIFSCKIQHDSLQEPLQKEFQLFYEDADVQTIAPSAYTATLGSEANIPCTFTSDQKLKDFKQFAVYWYYNNLAIAGTGYSKRYNTSKYSMDGGQALNGTANLTIYNISMADRGIYKCLVSYAQFREQTITVSIQAVPKITVVIDDVIINKPSFLCYEISEFYPVDINITWLRDGEPLGNVLEGKLQNNSDGTYSINSSIILRLTEEDRKRNFSCRVQHVSLPTPLNKDLQLYIHGDEKMSCTNDREQYKIATIILGLFLGILLLVICCCRKKLTGRAGVV